MNINVNVGPTEIEEAVKSLIANRFPNMKPGGFRFIVTQCGDMFDNPTGYRVEATVSLSGT